MTPHSFFVMGGFIFLIIVGGFILFVFYDIGRHLPEFYRLTTVDRDIAREIARLDRMPRYRVIDRDRTTGAIRRWPDMPEEKARSFHAHLVKYEGHRKEVWLEPERTGSELPKPPPMPRP